MDASDRIRIYGRLRTADLEAFRKMVPARVIYWAPRYDYDPTEADPANPPVQLTRLGTLREVARRHHTAVEINEPAMVDRWFLLLLLVLVVRARSLVARRRTTIATYCMANADPALEVGVRWHLPPGACRVVTRLMMTMLVRSVDRLAFATKMSHHMYRGYVGEAPLRSRARLFEAIPAACGCLHETSEERRPTQVLFVGGLLEHKGIRETMAAWEELHERRPDGTLVIVGKGRLEAEVAAWATHRPEVTMYVNPPRPTIHRALRTSQVLILLSRRAGHWREQIGNPIQEGLGHGCEIVTTSETGLAGWLAEHGHAVLPPDAPAAEVAAALEKALTRVTERTGSLDDLPNEDQRVAAERWMMAGPDEPVRAHGRR
jgi:glycosyltransferase involved in cell wall biosynthesis